MRTYFILFTVILIFLFSITVERCPEEEDTTPPIFDGIYAVYPCNESLALEWKSARDKSSPIKYKVYMSNISGIYNWDEPLLETEELGATINNLENGLSYFFVVRAVDPYGNEEKNTVEKSNSPLNTYPTLPYKELIFEEDSELFPSSHSSCIIELPGGELFTTWYCGRSEHSEDVAIYGSRRLVGQDRWTYPKIVQDTPNLPDGNAVIYLSEDSKLWLFWALQERFEWHSAKINYKISEDFGHTWGNPSEFVTPLGYLPRTHVKTLKNGWIIFPLYIEWSASSVLLISKDNGKTWEEPTYILPFLGIQPTVIQRSNLSLFAMMRTGAPPYQSWQAESKDMGENWHKRRISDLNNPGSSLEMAMLQDGDVVVVFNNSKESRSNLSIAISYDEGESWTNIKAIEDNPESSYSYPSVIQDKCGLIHITYSYDDRKSIAHFVTDKKWVKEPSK